MSGARARRPYYREDLALIHHQGFGFHADACAPGILELLAPLQKRQGLVVEIGCGSGLLTRHLVEAGHRVLATDASEAMLDLARRHAPGAEDLRQLRLPDDPVPAADAIVSVGHVLNYLDDESELDRALVALGGRSAPVGSSPSTCATSHGAAPAGRRRPSSGGATDGSWRPNSPRRLRTGSSG